MGKVIALAVMLALASCGTPGSSTAYCDAVQPIYPSAETAAAMTFEEKQQIVAHNETWEAACK